MSEDKNHVSVMLEEAVAALHIKKDKTYIDATLGAGGHSGEIIKRGGRVLGIEADSEMISIAKKELIAACPAVKDEFYGDYFKIVNDNFSNIAEIVEREDIREVSGVLFDLGISNLHLTTNKRGFSFNNLNDPLDMRLSPETNNVRAADLLNALREDQLRDLFSDYLTKGESKRLARLIVEKRGDKLFEKVSDFTEVCERVNISGKVNKSTLPFMALRIAVNDEFGNLEKGLRGAMKVLSSGNYMSVISFHSGEDRIVKKIFAEFEDRGMANLDKRNPILPSEDEINNNPKARSAKLRILKKI